MHQTKDRYENVARRVHLTDVSVFSARVFVASTIPSSGLDLSASGQLIHGIHAAGQKLMATDVKIRSRSRSPAAASSRSRSRSRSPKMDTKNEVDSKFLNSDASERVDHMDHKHLPHPAFEWEDQGDDSLCSYGAYRMQVDGGEQPNEPWVWTISVFNRNSGGNVAERGRWKNWIQCVHSDDGKWRLPNSMKECKEDAENAMRQLLLDPDVKTLQGNATR
jgi:hypothetical protein